jgi:hypothetical protein
MKGLRNIRANYRIVRGDTFKETLELVDADAEYITDEWTWKFTVRDSLPETIEDNDTNAEISKSGTFSDGTSILTLDPEDTNIDAGEYYFDYQLTKPDGDVHSTFYGYFIVEEDITRS